MKTRVLLLGLSTYAEFLLKYLNENGESETVAVDRDEETVNRIADLVSRPVIGNATNRDLLGELHVADMDYVVVSLGNLEASVICVLYLKDLGARHIVAKAMNPEHVKVLELLGVHEVVFPEQTVAQQTALRLLHPLVLNSMSFAGEQSLVEVRVPEELAGKRLQDLTLEAEYGLKAALILDGDSSELARPSDERVLKQGDALLLFGPNEKFFEMEKKIPGLPSLRARLAAGLRGSERED